MSDDESVMEKAFPLEELMKNDDTPLQPDQPPTNAIHYLRLVQFEAAKLDDVVVAKIDESKLKKQTVVYQLEDKPSSSLAPTHEWKLCQISDFSQLRSNFSKKVLNISFPGVELPKKSDEGAWCIFCLGTLFARKLPSPVSEYKKVREGDIIDGNPPLTRFICGMNQATVEQVLEYHVDWLGSVDGFSDNQGRWLYALLVRLELPLTPDMCSLLRTLARACAQKRDELACQDETSATKQTLITSLNLLICLVSTYFRQLDLEDL